MSTYHSLVRVPTPLGPKVDFTRAELRQLRYLGAVRQAMLTGTIIFPVGIENLE